ncbi:MAG: hypothetical protein GKR77_06555, partial [Legionellales bacterium]|nr:hypothetical protein [Legionellales bacterium]
MPSNHIAPPPSGRSSTATSRSHSRSTVARLSEVTNPDQGGIGFVNSILATALYKVVRLADFITTGGGNLPIANIVTDTHEVFEDLADLSGTTGTSIDNEAKTSDSDSDSENKLTVSSCVNTNMPNLPYKEPTNSYLFKSSGDAYRFQLLFVVRWIQQILTQTSMPQLNISVSRMQAENKIQFSWPQDCKEIPVTTIEVLQENGVFSDGFIPRVLGLFTLSKDQVVHYCRNSNVQKMEIRELFFKIEERFIGSDEVKNGSGLRSHVQKCLAEELKGGTKNDILRVIQKLKGILKKIFKANSNLSQKQKSFLRKYFLRDLAHAYFLHELKNSNITELNNILTPLLSEATRYLESSDRDYLRECFLREVVSAYFFNELSQHNILDLIKGLEVILEKIKNASVEFKKPDQEYLTKHFIIMVGVYFAVLPVVEHREKFIEAYGLQQDFKWVDGDQQYDESSISEEIASQQPSLAKSGWVDGDQQYDESSIS